MNPKLKKALIISGICLDVAIMIFLFVIAIIMIATLPKTPEDFANAIEINGPFIGYLQQNNLVYLFSNVLPLVLLLIANIVFLVWYIKKAGKAKATLADLSEEQREALRQELLKDMKAAEEEKK